MNITFDPIKRDKTLLESGLDFGDAAILFRGLVLTMEDDRQIYPEPRFVSFGLLSGRMVVVVWTPVEGGRRVISMRKANDREQERFREKLG